MKRILVVDDERQIVRMLRASLQSSGYDVVVAANGSDALQQLKSEAVDLIITDLAMPEMNGLELTRAVRRSAQTPIIVLSVRDAEQMKIRALDEGANDYVTKPFSMQELLARVRVQLRTAPTDELPEARIDVGDLSIEGASRRVAVRGVDVHLTPKEFELLLLLAREPGRVLTHKQLLRSIWGPAGDDQPEYLRVLVAGLRKKLDSNDTARYIESEPWVGYRLRAQPTNP